MSAESTVHLRPVAPLRSQHLCCPVFIATPDGYRKLWKQHGAKGSSEGKAMAWLPEPGRTCPAYAAARKPHQKPRQSGSHPNGSRNHRASPRGPPGSGALTTESRSRPCLKLLETPHHWEGGQHEPVRTQRRRHGLGDQHSPARATLRVQILPHPTTSPARLGSPIRPSAQPGNKCQPQPHHQPQGWSHSAPRYPHSAPRSAADTIHASPAPSAPSCADTVNHWRSLSQRVTGGCAEAGGERALTAQQTP